MHRLLLLFPLILSPSFAADPLPSDDSCARFLDLVFTAQGIIEAAVRVDDHRISPAERKPLFDFWLDVERKLRIDMVLLPNQITRLDNFLIRLDQKYATNPAAADIVLEYLSVLARHPEENYRVGTRFLNQYIDFLNSF